MRSAVRVIYEVAPSEAGERLDKWLTERLQEDEVDISRTVVQQWLKSGSVTRRRPGKVKASDPLEPGDVYEIEVPAEEPFVIVPDDVAMHIVYEDDDLVVVDKPRGVVVHPGAGNERGTLVNGLAARGVRLSPLGGEMRPGVVHRIDKDTSGLVMFAKTERAYYGLTEQLREHTVTRHYRAIVHGKMEHRSGTIDMPIARDPNDRQRMAARLEGKRAVTHFQVIEQFDRYAVVMCQLETGRTHQIRVHFAEIGHPLAGDKVYGRRHTLPIDGQALHAETLGFVHPATGQWMSFASALPPDMEQLIEWLRAGRIG
ncbi:pseudouridine synthase, RluA family [Alicyclobacillus hesperidum URH17-3-68]|uniref:Pseudouridine synthase n=1 Tax=Alicyclobacillus hesperidum TaxID=89784 RepID=A0AA37U9Z0_9BACL|nr:RluA family pseudouridine synthase [Alicyclobacillus hesperidum]EJY55821.1 pseudouridine synthase, RluA family [Alicyclobacillus hesperidum URH17-3-68]GLV14593.1 putative RNA pseudouridine synthase YlyB [Alicyclobacillus hesperidum]